MTGGISTSRDCKDVYGVRKGKWMFKIDTKVLVTLVTPSLPEVQQRSLAMVILGDCSHFMSGRHDKSFMFNYFEILLFVTTNPRGLFPLHNQFKLSSSMRLRSVSGL